jgi:DNA-binding transcriptional regulator YhcF (GntR family)
MMPAIDPATLALDEASPEPLFRQIRDRIAGAVLDGRLAPGARLPSARSLAAQLSIARGTVDAAYQLLAGEGYIVARGAAPRASTTAQQHRFRRPDAPAFPDGRARARSLSAQALVAPDRAARAGAEGY